MLSYIYRAAVFPRLSASIGPSTEMGNSTTSPSPDDLPDDFFSRRIGIELVWVHLQPFLLARGYKLRSRYDPDWRPSWGDKKLSIHQADKYEDSLLGPVRFTHFLKVC